MTVHAGQPGDRRQRDRAAAVGRAPAMQRRDLDDVFAACAPQPGRHVSRHRRTRGLPGRVIGGFRYYGTRPDDPNDVVPHEHRRELRALKVFGAWTNLVDMKAGNTLDTRDHRERPQRRAALPAGRRVHVWHRRHRTRASTTRARNICYEGDPTRKRLLMLGF